MSYGQYFSLQKSSKYMYREYLHLQSLSYMLSEVWDVLYFFSITIVFPTTKDIDSCYAWPCKVKQESWRKVKVMIWLNVSCCISYIFIRTTLMRQIPRWYVYLFISPRCKAIDRFVALRAHIDTHTDTLRSIYLEWATFSSNKGMFKCRKLCLEVEWIFAHRASSHKQITSGENSLNFNT